MTVIQSDRLRSHLDEVRATAAARLSAAEVPLFCDALEAIVAGAAPDEIASQSIEQIYGGVLALWRLAVKRGPGDVNLRVYNPRIDEHGWECAHTVVELVTDDMPFLVDSVASALTEHELAIHSVLHPVLHVRRGSGGDVVGLGARTDADATAESVMQIQFEQIGDAARLAALESELREVLADVRAAVEDWRSMLERVRRATSELRSNAPADLAESTAEATEFLDWLADDHFTFLGCRDYTIDENGRVVPEGGTGLGLMRDPSFTVFRDALGAPADWTPEVDVFLREASPILVVKANRRSTVHRAVHMDVIGVKRFDPSGRLVGEFGVVGLFTKAAYNRSPHNIPLLRGKVRRLIERAGFVKAGHNAKAFDNVLETYPRDELFQGAEEELLANALSALHLATRPRTRLLLRPDRFGRFMSCIVYVPRERYTTDLRARLGDILANAFDGRVASWTPAFTETLTRVHMVVAISGGSIPEVDVAELEARIVDAVRSWSDALREALVDRSGESVGARLFDRYGRGFSASYRETATIATALGDIDKMEPLTQEAPTSLKFFRRLEDPANAVRLKLYRLGPPVPLSDCIPMMENLGLRILEEHPYPVETDLGEIWIHEFYTRSRSEAEIDLASLRGTLEDAFAAVWAGRYDDDPLNRLVLLAGLSIRETGLLRAYSRFLRQARIAYSIDYMEDALAENPSTAGLLVRLFAALFDPRSGASDEDRAAAAERLNAEIEAALEKVESLDVDRILRRFRNAIMATVRTNYYQPDAEGAPKLYMSLKLDSGALEDLPAPRPWREVFVYSPWVEGVHLRGGPVARGGLRWSDRKEDYRTEILGLVKAQQVKNAVIVPVGSKGGFLPKSLPVGRGSDEIQAEAIRCYKTFLSGLLDVTDNFDGAAPTPPQNVVRRDGDDPYLVVAADKGTATFSDIANDLALSYGFWLGDAFASGGSNGYDHKKMGITARGAWEAVKRHFRELGHDTQSRPFTVIGVGDMSGDVFGNGMLLSDQIRLVAAFDHRDMFIDPDPDPATSFAERKRLFELPRSTWRDYDAALISKGGGVFSRRAKSIQLTPEIKALTGLAADHATPFELIKAVLSAEADLMWFGGIGTYVKEDDEANADVGDRANEAIRIDASALRVRVVGEGANLGVTQRGRIALSRRGVKINNDAVDNSAGVDCSDHEVNIKIALGAIVGADDMTEKQRNQLLAEMTDEVSKLVLRTNYAQTLGISLVEARAAAMLEDQARMMRALEAEGRLDREVELLPDDAEIAELRERGNGLTRPEIAVLVAYAKLRIYDALIASEVPEDPFMERLLVDYMPTTLRERHKEAILGHRLRREIISTVAANMFVDEIGPSTPFLLQEETGAGLAELVRAFIIARETFGLSALTVEINALDGALHAEAQTTLYLAVSNAAVVQTMRMLDAGAASISETIGGCRHGVAEVANNIWDYISGFARSALEERLSPLLAAGVPEATARRALSLEFLGGAVDIVGVSQRLGRNVGETAETYFATGARLGLDWLRFSARAVSATDRWDRIAIGRLIQDLRSQQSSIAEAALTLTPESAGAASVDAWAARDPDAVERLARLVREFGEGGAITVAKLAIASSQIRSVSVGDRA